LQVIVLLITALLTARLIGVQKSKYARMTIGSLFGFAYFAVWPFIQYLGELFLWRQTYMSMGFGLVSFLLAMTLAAFSKHLTSKFIGYAALSMFLLLTLVSMSFDIEIKQTLDNAFYLKPAMDESSTIRPQNNSFMTYHHASGGYSIDIPKNWKKKDDLGELFIYFQKLDQNKIEIELRPMCLDKSNISLGDIILNLRKSSTQQNERPQIECHRSSEDNFCLVQYKSNQGNIHKLIQFGISDDFRKGYYLEFIFNIQGTNHIDQIKEIIDSVRPSENQNNLQPCLGTSSWM
jgi:hypothetical protein